MRIILIILGLLIMFSSATAQFKKPELSEEIAEQRLFTEVDLMSMIRLSDPQISPDGTRIIYAQSTPKIDENKFYKDIWAVSIDGADKKRVTRDEGSEYNARWLGNNKIVFLSSRDGSPQIYSQIFPSGEPRKITNIDEGVANLSVSPDGMRFAFTSDVKTGKTANDLYPKYPKANVRIYTDLPARHWDEWVDVKTSHLFVCDVDGKNVRDLTEGSGYDVPLKPFGGAEQIAWSPDSKEIAYVSKKVDDFVTSTNSDIYVVSLETGKTKNISEGMEGFDLDPLYSPDGKYIAFISLKRAGFESDKHRLMLYDRKSGDVRELSTKLDQWIFEKVWAPDSKSIFFTATDSGTVQIFNMKVADGSFERVSRGQYNFGSGLGVTPDGEEIVFGRQSMTEPVDFFKAPAGGGEMSRLTNPNFRLLRETKKPQITQRWIESVDGAKVHCWVLYPPDFDPEKKYPMISYCQGGPQSMIGQRFHYRWNYNLMASKGYVVVLPNRRGAPGFGQKWIDAISLDWGGKPMSDILAATDALADEPFVDEGRIGAVGASAGGYAAFWLAGAHEGRFKAFISHCGVFNLESMYGSTEELWFPNWEYGGPYWEEDNFENYRKNSPHRFVKNWDTPIMISTGEYDFRVPYTQSLEAFTAARAQGIPAKLLVFPEETHFIAKPQNFIVWSNEFFGFLDKYVKNNK